MPCCRSFVLLRHCQALFWFFKIFLVFSLLCHFSPRLWFVSRGSIFFIFSPLVFFLVQNANNLTCYNSFGVLLQEPFFPLILIHIPPMLMEVKNKHNSLLSIYLLHSTSGKEIILIIFEISLNWKGKIAATL